MLWLRLDGSGGGMKVEEMGGCEGEGTGIDM